MVVQVAVIKLAFNTKLACMGFKTTLLCITELFFPFISSIITMHLNLWGLSQLLQRI